MEEVKQHNKPGDLWFIIKGNVYDVSNFYMNHPGGHLSMENMGGADATVRVLGVCKGV